MMAANNNETAQETTSETYNQKLKQALQAVAETVKTAEADEIQKILETVMKSPYGSIQAINTADDLLFNNSRHLHRLLPEKNWRFIKRFPKTSGNNISV